MFTSSDIKTVFNGPSHFSSQRHVRKSQSKAEKQRGECLVGLVKWKIIVFFVHMKCFISSLICKAIFIQSDVLLMFCNYVFKRKIVSL